MLNMICACTWYPHHVQSCVRGWSGGAISLPGCIFRSSVTVGGGGGRERERERTVTLIRTLTFVSAEKGQDTANSTGGVQTSGWRRTNNIVAAEHVAHSTTWKILREKSLSLSSASSEKDLPASERWPRKSVVCQCLQHYFAGNHFFYLRAVHIQGTMYLVWLYILPKSSYVNAREITPSRHQQSNWTLGPHSKPCVWQACASPYVEGQQAVWKHRYNNANIVRRDSKIAKSDR
jgi:hypothetical protein